MKFLPRALAALFVASLTLALVQSAATAQEAALTPAQIHAQLSPAIPQVETPLGSGSGILIDSRHVVTASHVIWPYDRANVRFADEQVFRDVRVVGFDLIADLAVLEFDSPLPFQPVTIADSSAAALGQVVYLMGYSNPVDGQVAAITQGLLSRTRTWSAAGLSYLETDAVGGPGGSGGAIVGPDGSVLGVVLFGDNGLIIGLSSTQARQRINSLLQGVDVDGLGDRFPRGTLRTEFQVAIPNRWEQVAYQVPASATGELTLTLSGTGDGTVGVVAPDGTILAVADDTTSGQETLTVPLPGDIPLYVVVVSPGSAGTYSLNSNVPLRELDDPDGYVVGTSGAIRGHLGHPLDRDVFAVDLDAGQTVTATLDSPFFDPFMALDIEGSTVEDFVASDDDSGGGFFGLASRLSFTARTPGRYLLALGDANAFYSGAYVLNITLTGSGGFVGTLPSDGVGLAAWDGGSVDDVTAGAAALGCRLRSFWISESGQFLGYLQGAPEFVNAAILERFVDSQVPAGTVLLVSCGSGAA